MQKTTGIFFKVLTLSFFSLTITLWRGPAVGQTSLRTGDTFPHISMERLDGNRAALPEAAAGKILIVHFWASWCPFCVKEMAAIESTLTDYKEKGVLAYSIDAGESPEAAPEYIGKTNVTYPILLDPTLEITKGCGVNSIPTTFVCDRTGIIRYKILGEINKMGLEKLLPAIL